MTTSATSCATCGAPIQGRMAFCSACGAATGIPAEPEINVLAELQAALQDRYKVERELGRGGMATVFLAEDLRHGRQVAIKVLHPELAASMGGERFDREIRVAAKLQHPHILSLIDSGSANKLLFYVMPFVVGESLRDRLDREQMLPIDDAINITLEVADALGYAHNLGIIHRDIKPENIMLSGGHALVADFGIARAVEAVGEQKLTQTGTAVGTPLYMSPEQAMGDEVGPTADLYSLGCVTYEMLTGQPPFTGANARAIMARHTMEMVPGIRLVRDTVPEEVEDALLGVLAKVPADRPQTAAQFAELLGTPLGATATRRIHSRSRITTAKRRISEPAPRMVPRRGAIAITVVSALVLAATLGGWAVFHKKKGAAVSAGGLDPRHIAVLYFTDNSTDKSLAYLADGLTEGLIGALKEVRDLDVVSKGGADQFRGSTVGPDSIARALRTGTLVTGEVTPAGDSVRVALQLIEGNSGATLERASFKGASGNALALGDALAREAARLVRSRLGEEIAVAEQRQGTRSVEAWVLVQRAERLRKRADSLAGAGDTTAFNAFAQADTLLQQAGTIDTKWIQPPLLRGTLAYRRSRLSAGDPAAAAKWIDAGLVQVQTAAARDSSDADLLELRGNLHYWKWLLGLEPDAGRARALLADAKHDLESATQKSRSQAGAWATLSHLYANDPEKTGIDVAIAAGKALEQDAFLGNAATIESRLFFAWYDFGDFPKAQNSCDEGYRRFATNPKFTECRLLMLTTRDTRDPSVVRGAWALADTLMRLTAESDTAYQRLNSRIIVAAVLARAGNADSARHLVERAQPPRDLDPTAELANLRAFVYTLLGDKAKAVDLLKEYVAANPRRAKSLADNPGWWYRSIAEDPAFKQLVAGAR